MNISDIELFPLHLPMKNSMSISGGTVSSNVGAPHVYVKITSDGGTVGWGEARPSPRWSYETLETVAWTIEKYLKPALIGMPVRDLSSIGGVMSQVIAKGFNAGQPIAKAAIEIGLHDLIARIDGLRLNELWQGKAGKQIDLTYLISSDNPEEVFALAKQAKETGYKGIDVKIGINKKLDADIIRAASEGAPGLFYRADANQAYSLPEALSLAKVMEQAQVDVFEQPLGANNLLGHAELRKGMSLPIALDESIWTPEDLLQAIRLEACDYVVIKATKMGGLRGAKSCGEIARAAGLGLIGGGLTETSLVFSASAQLFCYLGINLPVDLNGPFYLADDPVINQPAIIGGTAILPDDMGIGCRIDPDKLARYACT